MLPPDTDSSNIIERLILVAGQKAADDKESDEDNLANAPQGSKVKPPTLAMSKNPTGTQMSENTNQNEGTQQQNADKAAAILMSNYQETKRSDLKDRVKKLVETGRVSGEYADKKLYPQVTGFKMSLDMVDDSGQMPTPDVENLIEALESANPLTGKSIQMSMPAGSEAVENPFEGVNMEGEHEPSEEDMDKLLDNLFTGTSL